VSLCCSRRLAGRLARSKGPSGPFKRRGHRSAAGAFGVAMDLFAALEEQEVARGTALKLRRLRLLRGRRLRCHCPHGTPCHAEVLGKLFGKYEADFVQKVATAQIPRAAACPVLPLVVTDEWRAPGAGSLAAGRPAPGHVPEVEDIEAAAARAKESYVHCSGCALEGIGRVAARYAGCSATVFSPDSRRCTRKGACEEGGRLLRRVVGHLAACRRGLGSPPGHSLQGCRPRALARHRHPLEQAHLPTLHLLRATQHQAIVPEEVT